MRGGIVQRLIAKMRAAQRAIGSGAGDICARAAEAAAGAAREYVPVDTGALKSGIASVRTGALSASATASAPHAAYVEYGTSRMAPQSYMLPAARSAQAGFFAEMRDLAQRAAKG